MRDREKEKSMSYIKNADIQGNAWVAPGACVVGNVTLGDESSVWYNAVLRGDMAPIVVGCGSNVQDGTVVHADNGFPCKIGNGTSIGHNAIIHGCTIGNNTVIGMGAIIMNGAQVGSDCIIGAGSLVTKNTVIPDGSLVMGSPAKIKRNLTWEEKLSIIENSKEYITVSAEMQRQGVLYSWKASNHKSFEG